MWLFWDYLCGSPRLCWLSIDGLVPVRKYWMYQSHASNMGPISLVACCRQMFGLSTLLKWLSWERNWGRSHGPLSWADQLRGGVGSTFSREQWICPTLLDQCERLSRMGTTRRKRTPGIRGLAWEAYMSCWSGFPPVGCTSIRITVTLGYE
jgi:hypothetical protein